MSPAPRRFDAAIRATALASVAACFGSVGAAAPPAVVSVTLQADGEHCMVHDVKFLCAELGRHLHETLQLPFETLVRLRAGRGVPYQSVREVLGIIEKSGYRYPVPYRTPR